ncbi:MAG: AbrB/MazE/SpoVT family DNA-binding domain-containing protein [Patescibacteria group bacterium]
MHRDLRATATIRQRGQLTIPDEIREQLAWLKPNDVVEIETKDSREIIVKPYLAKTDSKKILWQKAWVATQIARSFKGKRGNLSKFIIEDREKH